MKHLMQWDGSRQESSCVLEGCDYYVDENSEVNLEGCTGTFSWKPYIQSWKDNWDSRWA